MRGATHYDQDWIDETIEAGVTGLSWPRPKPRPEAFDAKPVAAKPIPPKPAKRTIWQRMRRQPATS